MNLKYIFQVGKIGITKNLKLENIKTNIAIIIPYYYSNIVKHGLSGSAFTNVSIQIEKYLNILTKNNW